MLTTILLGLDVELYYRIQHTAFKEPRSRYGYTQIIGGNRGAG